MLNHYRQHHLIWVARLFGRVRIPLLAGSLLLPASAGVAADLPGGAPVLATAQALFSATRAESIPEEADIYGRLLGSWDLDIRIHCSDGTIATGRGAVHFARILQGHGVQDVWIGSAPPLPPMYGTTVRIFDPELGAWRIAWANPPINSRDTMIARREGDDIVQLTEPVDGKKKRWRFSEIKPDSFHWTGETAKAGSNEWSLETEFFARRRPSAAR